MEKNEVRDTLQNLYDSAANAYGSRDVCGALADAVNDAEQRLGRRLTDSEYNAIPSGRS